MAPQEILEIRKDPMNERAPRGLRTAFGWCIAGPISPSTVNTQLQCNSLSLPLAADQDLADAINRFLLIETYEARSDAKAPIGKEDLRDINILNDTTKFVGDRYESGLLCKSDEPNLPDNSLSVLNRFFKLERRLVADKNLGKRYSTAINEYINLGYAQKLSDEESVIRPAGRTWFLPHHPVINPKKPEKCRPVFDASAYYKRNVTQFCPTEKSRSADQFYWCIAPFPAPSSGFECRHCQNVSSGKGTATRRSGSSFLLS
jgi:hypothetical protein